MSTLASSDADSTAVSFWITDHTDSYFNYSQEKLTAGEPPTRFLLSYSVKDTLMLQRLNLFLMIIYPIFGILIGLLNGMTIAAFLKYKQLRTTTNTLLMSLTVSDALLAIPLMTIKYMRYISTDNLFRCLLIYSYISQNLSLIMSLISFLLISIERWFAVVFPFKFKTKVTLQRTRAVVICAWIYGILVVTVMCAYYIAQKPVSFLRRGFQANEVFPTAMMIIFFQGHPAFCAIASTCLFIHIYIILHKRNIQIAPMQPRSVVEQTTRKTTKLTAIILGTFLICWLPFTLVSYTAERFLLQPAGRVVYSLLFCLVTANSFMNFFIYAGRNKTFRKAYAGLILRKTQISTADSAL